MRDHSTEAYGLAVVPLLGSRRAGSEEDPSEHSRGARRPLRHQETFGTVHVLYGGSLRLLGAVAAPYRML